MSPCRFTAIFDSTFLTRGLVMRESLREVAPAVPLEIVCMDPEVRTVLERLELDGVGLIDLADLEAYDPALLEVRPGRSLAEYCWTAKPSLCRLLFDRYPETDIVVYADADLMFFADPALLLEELRGGSALVVPHRSPPDETWEQSLGTYNAGFVAFRRGREASDVLEWWRERCLEWCFERVEPGRYCDQKYLDEWSRRFAGIRSLEHAGGGLAPWNASRHSLSMRNGNIYVDGATPLVFFHFQSLRVHRGIAAQLCRRGLLPDRYHSVDQAHALAWSVYASYAVSSDSERLVYAPYVRRLAAAAELVEPLGLSGDSTFADLRAPQLMREAARAIVPRPVRRTLHRVRSLQRRGRDARLSRANRVSG